MHAAEGFLAVTLLLLCMGLAAAEQSDMDAEISHLLTYLAASDCRYVRNGTERFIELSASKSTLSGKSYSIRCPGQSEQSSKAWLNAELQRYRRAQQAH